MPPPSAFPAQRPASRASRVLWGGLGILFVGLGFIGALLPLMPTTVFLIMAAGCFARSSPRLETWLLEHPRFGPTLRAWRDQGAIGSGAKLMACVGMAIGFAVFWWRVRPGLLLDAGVAVALAACAAFVVTRPAPDRSGKLLSSADADPIA